MELLKNVELLKNMEAAKYIELVRLGSWYKNRI